jgi:hypothetical protein
MSADSTVKPFDDNEEVPETGLEGVVATEVGPYAPFEYWWTPQGFATRFIRSKFSRYFRYSYGDEVTAADMDALVSLFSLIAAFVLAVPFGVMTSLQGETLQTLKDALDNCPHPVDVTFGKMFFGIRAVLIQAVYAPLVTIVLSLFYFVLRPGELHIESIDESSSTASDTTDEQPAIAERNAKNERLKEVRSKQYRVFKLVGRPKGSKLPQSKLFVHEDYIAAANYDFRHWWHRGKFLVGFIAIGTIYAIVILCYVFHVYITLFVPPLSMVCSNSNMAEISSQAQIGWLVLLLLSAVFLYICF